MTAAVADPPVVVLNPGAGALRQGRLDVYSATKSLLDDTGVTVEQA